MSEESDPIVAIKVSMAEMKGMLTQALGDHSARINGAEQSISVERTRITEISNTTGRHEVMLTNQQTDIKGIHEKLNNNMPRTMMVVMGLIAACSLILSVINLVMGG